MDGLLIILKIGIFVYLCISFISHKTKKRCTTQELLEQNTTYEAREHEMKLLRDMYGVDAEGTVYTVLIEGEISINQMAGGNKTVWIGNVLTVLPHEELVKFLEFTTYSVDKIIARVACYGSKAYVLTLQDYVVGQGRAELNRECSDGTDIAKINTGEEDATESIEQVTPKVKVIGQRPATETEKWHFDPPKVGTSWVIGIAIATFLLLAFMSDQDAISPVILTAVYSVIILLCITGWVLKANRPRSDFNIVKMRGEIDSINNHLDHKSITVSRDSGSTHRNEYLFPESWQDKIPLNRSIVFEVCEENSKLVSVQAHCSITDDYKYSSAKNNKHFKHIALTLIIASFSFLIAAGPSKLPLVQGMLSNGDVMKIDRNEQFQVPIALGQRVSISELDSKCLFKFNAHNSVVSVDSCSKYKIETQDKADTNISKLSEQYINQLAQLNNIIKVRLIDEETYATLSNLAFIARKSLSERSKIIVVNKSIVAVWAHWVALHENLDNFQGAKEELIFLWQELDGTEPCQKDDCWRDILAYNFDEIDQGKYGNRQDVYQLFSMKVEVVDNIINEWMSEIMAFNRESASEANTTVSVISPVYAENAFASLYKWRGRRNDIESDKIFDRAELEKVVAQFETQQLLALDYGVVTAINFKDGAQDLIIDSTFTENMFLRILCQFILSALLFIVGALLGLYSFFNGKRQLPPNQTNQSSWVS